jgi:mannose-1-phosphate guanylyltransferase/mannose-1-phosphate guanylyltransferase/mannose-6-phosphate isomerase
MAETSDQKVRPVILSGGAGTRLWPLSVPERPKQFAALVGDESLFVRTARRVGDTDRFEAPVLVAGLGHEQVIRAQLGVAGIEAAMLILEPCPRNTAPAIALAALAGDPDDMLLVLPSDHLIEDEAAFLAAIDAALPLAAEDWLVTFGIAPDKPETGYGYIRRGEPLGRGVFRADAFVEKPDRDTAARYLAEGGYDWNAGIFLFRAAAFLRALEEFAPEILAAARAAIEAGRREGDRLLPDAAAFARASALAVDVAVMERSSRVAIAPAAMGWSDLGSWDALYALAGHDERGNAVAGNALALDSENVLVRSDGPAVVAIGVKDLIVVATGDAVLVVPRGESQRVKEALDALARRGQKDGVSTP